MKRLLWKELREKRLWLLGLTAVSALVQLLWKGLPFVGVSLTEGVYVVAGCSFLMGCTTYHAELKAGAVSFLYSRPVSWKQILAAKVIVGLAAVTVTTTAAFAVFLAQLPAEYLTQATPAALLSGFGRNTLFVGIGWFVGSTCSVVVPGVLGGTLTALVVGLGSIVLASTLRNTPIFIPELAGMGLAVLLLIRFGLTLPTASRVARFAVVTAAVTAVWLVAASIQGPPVRHSHDKVYVSPDGRYAAITDDYSMSWDMVDLKTGKRTELKRVNGYYIMAEWLGPRTFAYRHGDMMTAATMGSSGRARTWSTKVKWPNYSPRDMALSPDGKLVAIGLKVDDGQGLEVIDISGATKMDTLIRDAVYYTWTGNRDVLYADSKGKCHTMRLP